MRVARRPMITLGGLLLILAGARASSGEPLKIQGRPVQDWVAALRSPLPQVRWQAALVLAQAGLDAAPAAPALLAALKDPVVPVRRAAARALAGLAEAEVPGLLPGLSAALRDPDPQVRFYVRQGLVALGRVALPALIDALKDKKTPIRADAALGLKELGLKAREAVPALVQALHDKSFLVRATALAALADLGTFAEPAVPELAKVLRDPDERLRTGAAAALAAIGRAALPELARALDEGAAPLRRIVILAVASMEDREAALGLLQKALTDDSPSVRQAALLVLAFQGPEAAAMRPALRPLLQEPAARVRRAALLAFIRLSTAADDDLVPTLTETLHHKDKVMRQLAIQALVERAAEDSTAREGLGRALQDPEPAHRLLAAQGLYRCGVNAVPVLVEALRAPQAATRLLAIQVLGHLGPQAAEAIPALQQLRRQDRNPEVREWAQRALKALGAP
jgi:HEAT repeat protein